MATIIACGCEHEGPDRSKCGVWDGHPGACRCDCHRATHVAVSLNRAEVAAALAEAFGWPCDREAYELCKRWGIDR